MKKRDERQRRTADCHPGVLQAGWDLRRPADIVYIVSESPEVPKEAASCAVLLAHLFATTMGLTVRTEGHENQFSVPHGQRTWINFKPLLGPAGKDVADLIADAGLATCWKDLGTVSHAFPSSLSAGKRTVLWARFLCLSSPLHLSSLFWDFPLQLMIKGRERRHTNRKQ